MDKTEIKERVEKILALVLGHQQFALTDSLTAKEVSGWDSLTHMIIISDIEKEFRVRFKLREISRLENLGSLVALIQSKL